MLHNCMRPCIQDEEIHAKAQHDINACRRVRAAAALDPMRGFAGKTFITSTGRKLTAEQYLQSIERFSHQPGFDGLPRNDDGTVKLPQREKDPFAKHLSAAEVDAMQQRLSAVAAAPPRPPPRKAVWVQRQLLEVRLRSLRYVRKSPFIW